jgi:nucleoside-diphosphate-sugar epimerase
MPIALVTGATGFVGAHLIPALQGAGWTVRAAVRSSAGVVLPEGVDRVAVGDLLSGPDWRAAVASVEVVIHLAGRAHIIRETAADPLSEFRRANVAATEDLARCVVQAGARRVVFVSSIGVNGKATRPGQPFSESDPPMPHNAYARSKHEAEQALRAVAAATGLAVAIVRPPLVYGPGVKANVLRLLRLVDRGVPLPLAHVRNRRSLVGIGNLCDLIVACATHPAAAGETFLASDQRDLSTPELIRLIGHALGRPARLFPFPMTAMRLAGRLAGQGDAVERLVGSLQVDSTKATRLLGWQPVVGVEEGLRRTGEWYLHSIGQVR